MAFSLIPKEEKFFEMFEAQAAHNVDAAKVFRDLALKYSIDSPAFDRLRDIEHEADITTHEIIDKLNRTFVTPFDREDIHALASEFDDVVDLIQSISSRMGALPGPGRHRGPRPARGHPMAATENVRKAAIELKNPEKTRRLLDYCIEVNRLENSGDHVLGVALGKLFDGTPDPLNVINGRRSTR